MLIAPHYRERLPWAGMVTVTHRTPDGRVLHVARFGNLITDAGKDLLAASLRTAGNVAEIRYVAWGTGSTAPDPSDVALDTEVGRKIVTVQSAGGGVGECDTTVYLAPGQANVAIEELGWFAGSAATAAAGTGVLLARVLYSHTKTNLESIQVDRTDTLG